MYYVGDSMCFAGNPEQYAGKSIYVCRCSGRLCACKDIGFGAGEDDFP